MYRRTAVMSVLAMLAATLAFAQPAPSADLGTLPPARLDALLRTGGYERVGAKWAGCGGLSTVATGPVGETTGAGSRLVDLNGDGRDEAIVVDESTECYGVVGTAFQILTPTVDGGWKGVHHDVGGAIVLAARGSGNWADLERSGPGRCFPRLRWDGAKYAAVGQSYLGNPCQK